LDPAALLMWQEIICDIGQARNTCLGNKVGSLKLGNKVEVKGAVVPSSSRYRDMVWQLSAMTTSLSATSRKRDQLLLVGYN